MILTEILGCTLEFSKSMQFLGEANSHVKVEMVFARKIKRILIIVERIEMPSASSDLGTYESYGSLVNISQESNLESVEILSAINSWFMLTNINLLEMPHLDRKYTKL